MKLPSLAVFCLINQVSAACNFNTDVSAIFFHSVSKERISDIRDIKVTSLDDKTVRIQHTSKNRVLMELPLKTVSIDKMQVGCDFKTLHMTDNESAIGFGPKKSADKKNLAILHPGINKTDFNGRIRKTNNDVAAHPKDEYSNIGAKLDRSTGIMVMN